MTQCGEARGGTGRSAPNEKSQRVQLQPIRGRAALPLRKRRAVTGAPWGGENNRGGITGKGERSHVIGAVTGHPRPPPLRLRGAGTGNRPVGPREGRAGIWGKGRSPRAPHWGSPGPSRAAPPPGCRVLARAGRHRDLSAGLGHRGAVKCEGSQQACGAFGVVTRS